MKNLPVVLIVVFGLAAGCGDESPTTPTPSPLATPASTPNPSGAALWGFVRDSLTDAPLENARVEIIDAGQGSLTGRFVLTDASGRYDFFGITGSQSFRASKDGYEGEPRRLHLALTANATFALLPLHGKPLRETLVPGETKAGTVGPGDNTCGGMHFILPCKRFILIVNEGANLNLRLTWQGTDDVDLELWLKDTLFAASLTCQACGLGTSREELDRFVPAGEYELRATLYEGRGSSFTFSVTRVN